MNVLVTGANGFMSRNLVENLKSIRDGKNQTRPILQIETIYEYIRESPQAELKRYCTDCDFVFNLAGVNRPQNPAENKAGNYASETGIICSSTTLKKPAHQYMSTVFRISLVSGCGLITTVLLAPFAIISQRTFQLQSMIRLWTGTSFHR